MNMKIDINPPSCIFLSKSLTICERPGRTSEHYQMTSLHCLTHVANHDKMIFFNMKIKLKNIIHSSYCWVYQVTQKDLTQAKANNPFNIWYRKPQLPHNTPDHMTTMHVKWPFSISNGFSVMLILKTIWINWSSLFQIYLICNEKTLNNNNL